MKKILTFGVIICCALCVVMAGDKTAFVIEYTIAGRFAPAFNVTLNKSSEKAYEVFIAPSNEKMSADSVDLIVKDYTYFNELESRFMVLDFEPSYLVLQVNGKNVPNPTDLQKNKINCVVTKLKDADEEGAVVSVDNAGQRLTVTYFGGSLINRTGVPAGTELNEPKEIARLTLMWDEKKVVDGAYRATIRINAMAK